MIFNANRQMLEDNLLKSTIFLIDFYAPWCGPCNEMGRKLLLFAHENPDIDILKIDIEAESELAHEYHIMSVPTLVVVKDGKVAQKCVGSACVKSIKEMIERLN